MLHHSKHPCQNFRMKQQGGRARKNKERQQPTNPVSTFACRLFPAGQENNTMKSRLTYAGMGAFINHLHGGTFLVSIIHLHVLIHRQTWSHCVSSNLLWYVSKVPAPFNNSLAAKPASVQLHTFKDCCPTLTNDLFLRSKKHSFLLDPMKTDTISPTLFSPVFLMSIRN